MLIPLLSLFILSPLRAGQADAAIPPSASTPKTPDEAIKVELELLQGRWKIMGGNLPPEFMEEGYIEIDGDRMIMWSGMNRKEMRLKIDPCKNPKQFDMLISNRTALGIYKLEKDSLRLCYEVQANAVRPKCFPDVKSNTPIDLMLHREPK